MYYKYYVLLTDTLVGVALKFKEKPETIKTINNIQNDSEIYSRLFLHIPWEADKVSKVPSDILNRYIKYWYIDTN
jgi:hypothetical protein